MTVHARSICVCPSFLRQKHLPCHRFKTVVRPSVRVLSSKDEKQDLDMVEAAFQAVFGKKALEDKQPLGMKRLTADETPEMYPATTTEFADPLDGDAPDVAEIRPLLAKTQLEKAPLRIAYDAEVHGWSAQAFHERVDTFGAALVVAQTEGGAVIGGYNPKGWIGLGEERDAVAAFLFTWRDGDTQQRPVKLRKVGGAALAVIDRPDTGPVFGADGLKIKLAEGSERVAQCKLGSYYERLPDGSKTLFAGSENAKKTTLTSLRVYVAQGDGERWTLDGIVWKTSR